MKAKAYVIVDHDNNLLSRIVFNDYGLAKYECDKIRVFTFNGARVMGLFEVE